MMTVTDPQTLIPGQTYDLSTLDPLGWTEGDGTGHEGYDCWAYFDRSDRYLGPDEHGIEPLFAWAWERLGDGRHGGHHLHADGQQRVYCHECAAWLSERDAETAWPIDRIDYDERGVEV